jgi:two-component system, OmpR family, KDP operon response regulator KdpE
MAVHMKSGRSTPRILIVDDDRRLLAAMRERLERIGCSCICRDNASEAMLQFSADRIDIVVTDMTMPGIDGLSVVGMIRSQSDVPIIVISGHGEEYEPLLSGYERIAIMRKPFDLDSLLTCVLAALKLGANHARSSSY